MKKIIAIEYKEFTEKPLRFSVVKKNLYLLFSFITFCSLAQNQSTTDTTQTLNEVIVGAYQYNRSLKETPVALGIVAQKELNRFNSASIVSAMNTIPGVRMEERSPGSYRFSIRGSTLRSPFGVRDVKFYWNGLPLTDGGGNTYLNLLDFDAFGRAEIIKGPGASLYGAGIGGVALLNNPFANHNQIQVSASGGSFGFQRYQTSATLGNKKAKFFANYAHQQSDGYRQQSAMRRDAANLEGKFSFDERNSLNVSVFYTDLFYQTPGGLTLAQYNANPNEARQPSPTTAGAVQQKVAVYNKTIYASTTYDHQWTSHWSTRVGVYGSHTNFINPSITNYEIRHETNLGGRTSTQYDFEKNNVKGKINFGAEYQYFYSPVADYGNVQGAKDSIQFSDLLTSNIFLPFVQGEFDLPKNFFVTVGGSATILKYNFQRVTGSPSGNHQRNFNPVFSPRIALIKKVNESLSVFTSVSKGFSAPSLAEVRPNTGVYNNTLSPEQGINYELGLRGNFLKHFSFDVVGYDFEMNEAIVAEDGGNYFVNSGNTSQRGLETFLSWQNRFLKIWTSYTLTHYKFINYAQNGNDYSGHWWTGSPQNTLVFGFDLNFLKNFYWNFTSNYVDKIPLNDANTSYSSSYFLLGSRIGYKNNFATKTSFEIFAGVDNALNQKYSLGNDLNATANRFYNAAATRNFYFGVKIIPNLK